MTGYFRSLERHNAEVIDTIKMMNDEVAQELAVRMGRCAADRIRRRDGEVETVVDAVRVGWQYRCKTLACAFCRRSHVSKRKKMVEQMFSMASNTNCTFITVNHDVPVGDLAEVAEAHRKFSDELDNLRDRWIKEDRRFSEMTIYAALEVGHDGAMWRPRWHIVAHHPEVGRQELETRFQARWPGKRRVSLSAFDQERFQKNQAIENVANCVGYAYKFDCSMWSLHTQARFWCWMRGRAGLRSMSITLNSVSIIQRKTEERKQSYLAASGDEEGMPCVFAMGVYSPTWSPCNW